MLNYCGKFHYNQLINKGVTIQDGRQMDYILCFSVILLPMDSEMAGPIGLKLGVMVEGKCENNITKRFFGYFKFKMAANGLYSKKGVFRVFRFVCVFRFFKLTKQISNMVK